MTKTYYVATTHNGATTYLQLNRQKPLKVKAKANTKYLIYADDGTFVYNVHLKTAGDDVHVYLPQDNKAILTIEDYRDFVAVNDSNTLFLNNSTLMLTNPLANTVIATPTPSPSPIIASIGAKTTTSIATTSVQTVGAKKASTWALAGLGLVGAGVALAGGKDNSIADNNPVTPELKPTITINPITDDNIINIKESQSIIAITGTVNNIKNGDILNLKIGSASQTVAVTNGRFSLNLDGKTLVAHKEIIAEIARGGRVVSSEKHIYSIDTHIDTPTIDFNPITGDNIIDETEAKGKITVTGNVTNAKDGDEIIVSCGCPTCSGVKWIDIKTTVTGGKFSVDFNGSDMVANNGNNIVKATVTTSDTAKNTATATAEQDYKVAINSNPRADQQAQIYLNDVKLDLAQEIGSVRLSGKLDFANSDSMYKWGHNKDFVQDIKLKIGEKTFDLKISQQDYSFYLDLSNQEYQALKGQAINYELKAVGTFQNWLPVFDYKTDVKERWVGIAVNDSDYAKVELSKVKVNFDNNNIQNNKIFDLNINTKTEISGKVVNANANDEITINIAGKEHKATVKNDLTFSIQVENSELNNLKNIQATLSTKNSKGENISVSDVGYILQDMQTSENFVNPHEHILAKDRITKHTDPNYNFPYFIHANITWESIYNGFLNKIPFAGVGKPVTIKYYFVTQEDYDSGRYQPTHLVKETWSAYPEKHKEVAREIYKQFENATNIKFVETLDEIDKDTFLMRGNSIFPHVAGTAGYGSGLAVNVYDEPDSWYKQVLFHEILHTLGAVHVGDTFEKLDYAKNEIIGGLSNLMWGKDDILRVYDLAYLHYRFGVNPNHNSGNDVYRFQNFTDKTSEGGIYIWDGGGVDTFDASQEKEGVNVNLTPGSWIYRGEKVDSFVVKDKIKINDFNEVNKFFPEFPDVKFIGNVNFKHEQIIYQEGQAFIGYGTQLENLIGSNYADILKGNKADNNIFGGAGNDSIDGDDGNDYLDGGQGVDILTGGRGNDIFVVDNNDDVVIERTNQGTDTIYSFADTYTLPSNVEHIRLFATAQNATGNELSNTIFGNDLDNQLIGGLGNDTLSGGRGNDVLIGGAGADTFVFDDLLDGSIDHIIDFNPSDDKIALSSAIFNNLTKSNIQDHIKYDKDTGYVSYHYDNSAIHFATLTAGLDGDLINYQII